MLRDIRDIFTGAGFTDDVTYEAWGNRRELVEDYYHTLNLAKESDIAKLFSAVNEATVRIAANGEIEGLSDLIRLMQRDGYSYEDGTFMPRGPEESPSGRSTTWSVSAYSLICYGGPEATVFRSPVGTGTFRKDRLFEYTSDDLKDRYEADLSSLAQLPALFVAEAKPGGHPNTPAFLAQIEDVRVDGNDIRFRFRRIRTEPFSSEEVFGAGLPDINTQGWEHSRTHWAIKHGDLLEGLFGLLADRVTAQEARFPSIARPRFFRVDDWPLPVLGHVAVMMPFDPAYDVVYETIRSACRHHNLDTIRVDEIFRPSIVVDDVFQIIVQSRFVICDLTKRNPNVLYETGIAHARNCEVLMIVQNEEDIPFDLRHIRFVKYLPNREGYGKLQADLESSISAILEGSN